MFENVIRFETTFAERELAERETQTLDEAASFSCIMRKRTVSWLCESLLFMERPLPAHSGCLPLARASW